MAEQGTHKPLVPSSNLGVATYEPITILAGGAEMICQATRIVTPVTWLAAPEWLTVQQAVELSGHDEDTVKWLILDGGVEARQDGDTWLIGKASLHEYQETLALVLYWWDG
jgi:hypothetical protein